MAGFSAERYCGKSLEDVFVALVTTGSVASVPNHIMMKREDDKFAPYTCKRALEAIARAKTIGIAVRDGLLERGFTIVGACATALFKSGKKSIDLRLQCDLLVEGAGF